MDKDIKIIDETNVPNALITSNPEPENKINSNNEHINGNSVNPEEIAKENLKTNDQKNEDVEFLQVF